MYGCVTLTLVLAGSISLSSERHTHHKLLLLQIIGFQRRQRSAHRMSYAKAPKKGTMRERRVDNPQTTSPLYGDCAADDQYVADPPGDVWNDGWGGGASAVLIHLSINTETK